MRMFFRSNVPNEAPSLVPARAEKLAATVPAVRDLSTFRRLESTLTLSSRDLSSGRFRVRLYRFLERHVPLISSVVWTWSRLVAAGGRFEIDDEVHGARAEAAQRRLEILGERLLIIGDKQPAGLTTFLTQAASTYFRDGIFAGFVTVLPDGSGVDRFCPVDAELLEVDMESSPPKLKLETEREAIDLDRPDFYWLPLDADPERPFGRSILQAVPFVSYIEQQLVDDMRRASHNAGFHRLHVRITPPERQSGESDQNYVQRINKYFDDTVGMIRSCDVDDNPVTWDNVTIEHIGPTNTRSMTNSWFMHHRTLIEEICAGTKLAPFLLGYSYGATTTWSAFKFDLVMRQVRTVQSALGSFLEWLAKIDLALGGFEPSCRFEFDNTFAYQASEEAEVDNRRIENILRLYENGLLSKDEARHRIGESG